MTFEQIEAALLALGDVGGFETVAAALAYDWEEADHPRGGDPKHPGRFSKGGGGGKKPEEAPEAKPPSPEFWRAATGAEPEAQEAPKGKAGKKKVADLKEFTDKGIRLDSDTVKDKVKQDKFLQIWNDHIGEAPEQFKQEFTGGLQGSMEIEFSEFDDSIRIAGHLTKDGVTKGGIVVGSYSRVIQPTNNSAYSAYFELKKAYQGSNIGKQLLRANIDMYRKLGLDKVEVSANIDVGGYAWAKYGYVPTEESWRRLSRDIREKIASKSSQAQVPPNWDAVPRSDRMAIRDRWMVENKQKFQDDAKLEWIEFDALPDVMAKLGSDFDETGRADWAKPMLEHWRERSSLKDPPSVNRIIDAVKLDYEGKTFPKVSFAAGELDDLDEETRDDLSRTLVRAFSGEAFRRAWEMTPPDYIDELAAGRQLEHWNGLDAEVKYDWAKNYDVLPKQLPDEASAAETNALLKLARSTDPKALWAISDSPAGKELLLETSWSGTLDLHDEQSMRRFDAYVSKGEKKPAAPPAKPAPPPMRYEPGDVPEYPYAE